jgi:hypothetical protein
MLKSKYATPRSRKTMLWARVISEGIKAIAPEVNFGQYTTEELEDIADSVSTTEAKPVATPAPNVASGATVTTTAAPSTAPITNQPPVTAAPPTTPPATTAATEPIAQNKLPLEPVDTPAATFLEAPSDSPATEQQREEAIRLLGAFAQEGLNWTERLKTKLQHHKIAGGILGLTHGEAQSLIDKLKARDFESWYTSAIFGHVAKMEGSHRPS